MKVREIAFRKRHFLLSGAEWLLLGLLVFAAATAASRSLRGAGELEFYLDEASFLGHEGKDLVEIYAYIPNNEVKFKEEKGKWEAKIQMLIRIRELSGKDALKDQRVFEFFETSEGDAVNPLRFQTVILRYKLSPGKYKLDCKLEDLNSPKLTFTGMIKKRRKSSWIRSALIDIPSFNAQETNLSDPKFLWNVGMADDREVLQPNPRRMYGLYNDSLIVYYELYVPADLAGAVNFKALIINERGEVVGRSDMKFSKGVFAKYDPQRKVRIYPIFIRKGLTTFPAGTYTLFGQYGYGNRSPVRIRGGNFSVAWEIRTWEEPRRNLLAEARFLMDDEEYKEFKNKDRAEQEKMLKKIWKGLDPDPATGINEAYEEFLRRLDYVNANYSDYELGPFTDRGLIYLRYGNPDDVIVDVLPMNRESTSDAVAKVVDKFHPVNFSTHGARPSFRSPSQAVVMDRRRIGVVGEGGEVAYPYELWIYNGHGHPILPKDKATTPSIGLRFIFIDREGFGRYKLEISSSLLDEN